MLHAEHFSADLCSTNATGESLFFITSWSLGLTEIILLWPAVSCLVPLRSTAWCFFPPPPPSPDRSQLYELITGFKGLKGHVFVKIWSWRTGRKERIRTAKNSFPKLCLIGLHTQGKILVSLISSRILSLI